MNIRERLQKLHNEEYTVIHKLMGKVSMDGYDLIRVRGVKEGKTVEDYCKFLYAERLDINYTNQKIEDELLNKDIIHEEVWMIGGDYALDMFIEIYD